MNTHINALVSSHWSYKVFPSTVHKLWCARNDAFILEPCRVVLSTVQKLWSTNNDAFVLEPCRIILLRIDFLIWSEALAVAYFTGYWHLMHNTPEGVAGQMTKSAKFFIFIVIKNQHHCIRGKSISALPFPIGVRGLGWWLFLLITWVCPCLQSLCLVQYSVPHSNSFFNSYIIPFWIVPCCS